MSKTFLQIGSVLLLFAVILGAFAAHGLEDKITVEQISTFETGVRYQFYHGFAILIVGVLLYLDFPRQLRWAAWCFLIGILLFSGSIYLLANRDWLSIESWSWIGPITPIGGTFFIGGWVVFFLAVGKKGQLP